MESDQIAVCNLFNKDKQEQLFKFLHACVDEICNCAGPTFPQFTDVDWSKAEFEGIHKLILSLLCNPSCLYANEEKMPLEYHEFPEHVQQAILTCLRVRKIQLTDALLLQYSSKYFPTLVNFDWRLKYVMGSSKIASLREPLLQLDLILKEKEQADTLELELNKDELDSLINAIEPLVS